MSNVVKLRSPCGREGSRIMQSFLDDSENFECFMVIGITKDDMIEYGHTAMPRSKMVGLLETLKYNILRDGDERADV